MLADLFSFPPPTGVLYPESGRAVPGEDHTTKTQYACLRERRTGRKEGGAPAVCPGEGPVAERPFPKPDRGARAFGRACFARVPKSPVFTKFLACTKRLEEAQESRNCNTFVHLSAGSSLALNEAFVLPGLDGAWRSTSGGIRCQIPGGKAAPAPPGKECSLAGGRSGGGLPRPWRAPVSLGTRSPSPSVPLRRSLEMLRVCSAFQRASIIRRLLSAAPKRHLRPPRSFRDRKVGLPPPSAGPFPHSRQPPGTRRPSLSQPLARCPASARPDGQEGGGLDALLAWSKGVFGQWEGGNRGLGKGDPVVGPRGLASGLQAPAFPAWLALRFLRHLRPPPTPAKLG